MPEYEWSKEHKAFIKQCSSQSCGTGIYVGADNEVESLAIFMNYFDIMRESNKASADGLQNRCKDCRKITVRTHAGVKNLTGLIVSNMLIKQDGKCAICTKPINLTRTNTAAVTANIDHDHDTGKIRELLCKRCNVGLGFLENKEWNKKALSYLAKHEALNEIDQHKQSRRKAPIWSRERLVLQRLGLLRDGRDP